jgi:two-component system, NarL family, response regulator NreC
MTRVLLAEDHTMVRQGLSRMLESAGLSVVGETADGLQVAPMVEETRPDVLLLDMGLPGLHGLDVIRQVVRRSPGTKILVLSGDGREEFVLGSLRNGASGYLLKGGDSVELITAIAHIAGGGRYVTAAVSDHLVKALLEREAVEDSYEALTPREREVFHLSAEGRSNRQIGSKLCISSRTVETHRGIAMRKLGLHSQTEIVRYALRRGLITPEG